MFRKTNDAAQDRMPADTLDVSRNEQGMMRWQAWLLALLVGFVLSASSIAWSTEVHQMKLTHHEFDPWDFVPKPGDRIDIHNHSDIVHAVYVTYPDGTIVNLTETAAQLPGTTVSWTVPADAKDGDEYVLRCWIHTIIRADLKVKRP